MRPYLYFGIPLGAGLVEDFVVVGRKVLLVWRVVVVGGAVVGGLVVVGSYPEIKITYIAQ